MTVHELRKILKDRDVRFTEKKIQDGVRFECLSGEIFNVYRTGKMSFQGKTTTLRNEVEAIYKREPAPDEQARKAAVQPQEQGEAASVFIVYGHDTAARDQLELILRRMKLDPIILGRLPAAGDTIIEKLEKYIGEHGDAGFACVLLTPDDEGHKAGKPEEKRYRARQNVVLELGMVLARLGRKRVAILHKQSVELPSDIAGLLYIPFTESVEEVQTRLFNELRNVGYKPDLSAL